MDEEDINSNVRVATPCELPGGTVTQNVFSFSSGRIIVKDDLLSAFPTKANEKSYNSFAGQIETITALADVSCAYGPVGNTSPGLFREKDTGKMIIANFPWTEPEDYGEEPRQIVPNNYEELATVYTDLWAYCIADYDLWLANGGAPVPLDNSWGTSTVVEVVPGEYKVTNFTTVEGFDNHAEYVIFAELELVSH